MSAPDVRPGRHGRVRKSAELVADEYRRQIVTRELEEGDSLPSEAEMLEQFNVSRPTLREALRVLESESLISVHRGPRGGVRVTVPRVDVAARYAGLLLEYRSATTADLFRAACDIEAPCAGILARIRTPDDVERLRSAVEAERAAAKNPQELLALQNDFHRLLMDMVGNNTLRVLSSILRHIIDTATLRYLDRNASSEDVHVPASLAGIKAHAKLVDLIEKGDAPGAEALWRRQITATGAHLLKSGVGSTVLDLLD